MEKKHKFASRAGHAAAPWTAVLALAAVTFFSAPAFAFHGHRGEHTPFSDGSGQGARSSPPTGSYHDPGADGKQGRGMRGYRGSPRGLGGWLQQHGNMPLPEQEKALRNERGFKRLPPQTQQRLMNRLKQIDSMPPDARERTLDRIQAVERLNPQQRREVRSSVQAIHQLPPERRRTLKSAFQDLRNYPPEERRQMLASPRFQQEFSPQERNMLSNVLSVEPYEPDSDPSRNPPGR